MGPVHQNWPFTASPITWMLGAMTLELDNRPLRQQIHLDRKALRLTALFIGLTGYGVSMAGIMRAGLGVDPWDVLHVAVAQKTGLSVGTVVVLTALVVLLAWWPLKQHPGIGTLANAVWIGVACDAALAVLPTPEDLAARIALLCSSVLINGLADAVYIGAQLGPGPRDGLMTGLHRVTDQPIGVLRVLIEGVVLLTGWALGGPIGPGTVLYALTIGPIVHFALPRVLIRVQDRPTTRMVRPTAKNRGPSLERKKH